MLRNPILCSCLMAKSPPHSENAVPIKRKIAMENFSHCDLSIYLKKTKTTKGKVYIRSTSYSFGKEKEKKNTEHEKLCSFHSR